MKITIRLIVIIIVVVVALAVAVVASKQPAPVTDTFLCSEGVCSREPSLYFGDGFKAVQSTHSTCFIFVLEFLTCYKTLLFVF